MADTITPVCRSENMRRIRSKNMTPELEVRRLLFRMGYRYRLHARLLPGHPDIIFQKHKPAIFVHGCFWHQHGAPNCKITRLPKSRLDYWLPKLERNKQRDLESIAFLKHMGWKVCVIWECETKSPSTIKRKLNYFLKSVCETI